MIKSIKRLSGSCACTFCRCTAHGTGPFAVAPHTALEVAHSGVINMSKAEEETDALHQLTSGDSSAGLLAEVTSGRVPKAGAGTVVMYFWSDWVSASVKFKAQMQRVASDLVRAQESKLLGGKCYACCPMNAWEKTQVAGTFTVSFFVVYLTWHLRGLGDHHHMPHAMVHDQ